MKKKYTLIDNATAFRLAELTSNAECALEEWHKINKKINQAQDQLRALKVAESAPRVSVIGADEDLIYKIQLLEFERHQAANTERRALLAIRNIIKDKFGHSE